jgi:hypothetical protein
MTSGVFNSLAESYQFPASVELIVCEYLGRPAIAKKVDGLDLVEASTHQFWLSMLKQLTALCGKRAYAELTSSILQSKGQQTVAQLVINFSNQLFLSSMRVGRSHLVAVEGEETIKEVEEGLSLYMPTKKGIEWQRYHADDTFITTICTTIDKTTSTGLTAIQAMERVHQKAPEVETLEFPELESFKLNHLPLDFAFFTGLKQLTVNSQELSDVSMVRFMVNLEQFSANHNRLTDYPIALTKLPNLKVVKLNNNFIEQIPEEIEESQQLTTLHLTGNKVKAVPACFDRMQNLTLVYLTKNLLNGSRCLRPNLIIIT